MRSSLLAITGLLFLIFQFDVKAQCPTTSSISGNATVCSNAKGISYSVTNIPGSTYVWTISNGVQVSGGNTNSITVDWGASPYMSVGSGNVSVVETFSGGCTGAPVNLPIVINPKPNEGGPIPGRINGNAIGCSGVVTPYNFSGVPEPGTTNHWTVIGGTGVGTGAAVNVTWGPAGPGSVTLVRTNLFECSADPITLPVTIRPTPTVSVTPSSASVCKGSSVNLEASGATTYAWSPASSLSDPAGANVIATPSASTNYSVTGTTDGCSSSPKAVLVTVRDTPDLTAIQRNPNDSPICAGRSVALNAYPFIVEYNYTWTPATGLSATSGPSVSATPATTTSYTVTATDVYGCTKSVSYEIGVKPQPNLSVSPTSTIICRGATAQLQASGAQTYSWTPVTNIVPSLGPTVSVWPTTTTTYTVTGTGENYCTKSLPVTVVVGIPPTSSISGPTPVCESSTGVGYSVTGNVGSTYAWTITGGTQVSGTNTNSITVNWGTSGPGNVRVVETFAGGCSGAPVDKAITINPKPVTGGISGVQNACATTSGMSYSVSNTAGSTYAWTISGGTQVSGANTNSITVDWGAAGVGSVSVVETNSFGCSGQQVNLPVTINAKPSTSAIIGNSSLVCASMNGSSYSVSNTPGSTYTWVIAGGTQVAGTNTNSILVDWGHAGIGSVSVAETTAAGCSGSVMALPVVIHARPGASAIVGSSSVCENSENVSYNISNTSGSSYAWTITGGTQSSGGDNNNITVHWAGAGPGSVSVIETNAAGCSGPAIALPVTIDAYPAAISINGAADVCASSTPAYSVPNRTGSTYAWTITGGTQGTGTNTNSITVNWGSAGMGDIRVVETNASGCAGQETNLPVVINARPATSAISGNAITCANSHGLSYNVTSTAGSTYLWNITGGAQGDGASSSNITVNWSSAGPANVNVIETNAAGCSGSGINLPVTINSRPVTGPITGNVTVCSNTNSVSYSVGNTSGSSYAWTITGGTQVSGANSNSITVNWGGAGSGNVSVIETNAAGCTGQTVNLAVTINAKPVANSISGAQAICANTSAVPYGITNTSGSTYVWTISGGTQTGGINTNSITVNWGSAGTGNVSVVETNAAGCAGTAINLPVTINARPVTQSIIGSGTVCANTSAESYSVASTPGSTYLWTVAGGTQVSGTNTNSITVTWGSAGNGAVNVIETNTAGCSGSVNSLPVSIDAPVVSAPGTNLCAGETMQLSPSTGGSWSSSDNTKATVTSSGFVTTVASGNVQFIFTQTSTGCSSKVSLMIGTTSSITGSAAVCANATGVSYSVTNVPGSTYVWNISNGVQVSGGNTNSITVDWGSAGGNWTPGAGNVSVVESFSAGCTGAPVSLPIVINPKPYEGGLIPGRINGNAIGCSGVVTPYNFSGILELGTTYNWTVVGGTGVGTGPTVNVTWGPAGSGSITLVRTTSLGCSAPPVIMPVTINSSPAISVTPSSAAICRGSSATLTASGATTYEWSPASGLSATTGAVVTATPSSSRTYSVTGTANGCASSPKTVTVTVNELPTLTEIRRNPSTSSICAGSSQRLDAYPFVVSYNYAWTPAAGLSTTSGVVVFASPASTTTYTVTATSPNGCTKSLPAEVIVVPKPSTSAISGAATVCANSAGNTYSVVNTAGNTYAWTITGGTQVSGTNTSSITVSWGAAGTGNVRVVETNAGGCAGAAVNLPVIKNAGPVTGNITGTSNVCPNTNGVMYSVPNTSGSSYAWTVSGGTQITGANTNSITVNWGASGSGNVAVVETNTAGCSGSIVNFPVTIHAKPVTSAIAGNAPVCASTNGVGYSVTNTPGSTYTWSVTGGTQASGSNTNSITVNWSGAGAGNVSVVETNAAGCVGTAVSLPVAKNARPVTGAISGSPAVCVNTNGVSYSVSNTSGSTYAWTITGGTQASGGNSSGITVTWGGAVAGNVSVLETNAAGCQGTAINLPVSVNAKPSTTSITGTSTVCANSNGISYSVINTSGSTYAWTITGGTQNSGSNTSSIAVNWGGAGAGNVSVTETNAAGCSGVAMNLPITKNPGPAAIVIDGLTNVCVNTNGVAYSVGNTPGSTYAWTITGGTQASGANSSNITANWGSSGTGSVSVIETNAAGCTGSLVSQTVSINQISNFSVTIDGPSQFCAGSGGVYLRANTNNVPMKFYSWSDGYTDAFSSGNVIYTGGTYTVTVTDAGGCTKTSAPFTVNTISTINGGEITRSPLFCLNGPGQTMTLTASPSGSGYSWSTGATTQSITVSTPGTYFVNYTVSSTPTRACADVYFCQLRVDNASQGEGKEIEKVEQPENVQAETRSSGFNIYPNPADRIVTIDVPETGHKHLHIKILNVAQSSVFSETFDGARSKVSINVEQFAAGIYLVVIQGQNFILEKKRIVITHQR